MYNPCIINQAFFTYVLFLLHLTINVVLIYVHSLKWDKFAHLMNINKIIWNYLLWASYFKCLSGFLIGLANYFSAIEI